MLHDAVAFAISVLHDANTNGVSKILCTSKQIGKMTLRLLSKQDCVVPLYLQVTSQA